MLVVVGRYSRYPEVETVRSAKAWSFISKFDKIFATPGIPSIVKVRQWPIIL